jgi:hypothetical protein
MTNLAIIVSLWVNLVTNPIPAGVTATGENFFEVSSVSSVQQYLPDGAFLNASTVIHHSWVTNQLVYFTNTISFNSLFTNTTIYITNIIKPVSAASLRTIKQFSTPPVPPSSSAPSAFPIQAPQLANGGPDQANYCLMFKSSFQTQTNFIYGLYSSPDMLNWALCPPEIDGTGTEESFFDECLTNPIRTYRIMARVGNLPP